MDKKEFSRVLLAAFDCYDCLYGKGSVYLCVAMGFAKNISYNDSMTACEGE